MDLVHCFFLEYVTGAKIHFPKGASKNCVLTSTSPGTRQCNKWAAAETHAESHSLSILYFHFSISTFATSTGGGWPLRAGAEESPGTAGQDAG
jgi:hypothetical protein